MAEEKKKKKKIIPHKTKMAEQAPKARAKNFNEVALGYSESDALKEAERCLQCKKPKCVDGCPVSVPIPEFIQAVSEKDFKRAVKAEIFASSSTSMMSPSLTIA